MTAEGRGGGELLTTRLDASRCPQCGYLIDAATNFNARRKPRPNSVAICVGCAAVLVFTESLYLRAATDAEWQTWRQNPQFYAGLTMMVGEVQRMIRERTERG